MDNLVIVVLAGGKGTRMKSTLPKVCHRVGDKTMIEHVVGSAEKLKPIETIVVVSKDNVRDIRYVLQDYDIRIKIQTEPLGTAHAVLSAFPCCNETKNVLVLLGDVPLITEQTMRKICSTDFDAVVVGFINKDTTNKCGRILIENKRVKSIIEYAEATSEQRKITLCNSGMLWIKSTYVNLLYDIGNNNVKGEYYLTDIVDIMVNENLHIGFLQAGYNECMGANTPQDLDRLNQIHSQK